MTNISKESQSQFVVSPFHTQVRSAYAFDTSPLMSVPQRKSPCPTKHARENGKRCWVSTLSSGVTKSQSIYVVRRNQRHLRVHVFMPRGSFTVRSRCRGICPERASERDLPDLTHAYATVLTQCSAGRRWQMRGGRVKPQAALGPASLRRLHALHVLKVCLLS